MPGAAVVPIIPVATKRTHTASRWTDAGRRWHLLSTAGRDVCQRGNLRNRRGIGTGCDLSDSHCVARQGIWRKIKTNRSNHVRTGEHGRRYAALARGTDVDKNGQLARRFADTARRMHCHVWIDSNDDRAVISGDKHGRIIQQSSLSIRRQRHE